MSSDREARRVTPRAKAVVKSLAIIGLMFVTLTSAACSLNSPKRRYVLAEKLWADGKYSAAVAEFDRVVTKDPKGELGLQALYRSAMTQALYLGQYPEAIRKFRTYAEASAFNPKAAEAKRQVGDILYSRLERYAEAITHYRMLVGELTSASVGKGGGAGTTSAEANDLPEFRFRLAKSYFYVWQFADALAGYQELIRLHPRTPQAERAAFEMGVTHYTQGERKSVARTKGASPNEGAFGLAIDAYQRFIKEHPRSQYVPEAHFGIAASLEELDRLDEALEAFTALKKTYPSPQVVEIRIHRIRERANQQHRDES